jgi:hypothetical protein
MADDMSAGELMASIDVPLAAIQDIGAPGDCVVIYSSKLDGFGTARSDLDIYVVHPGMRDDPSSARFEVRDGLDIERWTESEIAGICQQAVAGNARIDTLKVIYRLATGIRTHGTVPPHLLDVDVCAALGRCFAVLTAEEINSTNGFIGQNDEDCGFLTARRALTFGAMAWCAWHGKPIFKEKWLLPALRAMDPELAGEYWERQMVTAPIDTASIVALAQDLADWKEEDQQ